MKVKCQVYSPSFEGEREEGKKTHGHVILLDSIKYSNNFALKKKSLTNLNQIKSQILTKKKKKKLIYTIFYTKVKV